MKKLTIAACVQADAELVSSYLIKDGWNFTFNARNYNFSIKVYADEFDKCVKYFYDAFAKINANASVGGKR